MTTAPSYVDRAPSRVKADPATAVGVIVALSASHLLNDTMQSLASALYPVFREKYCADILPDRRHNPGFPDHGLSPPAADRYGSRQAAGQRDPALRYGLHAGRPRAARLRQLLSVDPHLGRGGRNRQRRLSPGSVARRAVRIGRAAWIRPEPVSGRRQFRAVARPAAGGVHRRAVRPEFRRGFHCARAGRGRASDRRRALVRGAPGRKKQSGGGCRPDPSARDRRSHPLCVDRDAVFESGLSRQHQQLLHVLSDSDLRRIDPERAGPAVRVSRLRRNRDVPRRPAGRPLWREIS